MAISETTETTIVMMETGGANVEGEDEGTAYAGTE